MNIANELIINRISNILPLSDQAADLATVGGKGASLARLVRAGLPVPDGFFIATEAYRCFVTYNELQPLINSALLEIDERQSESLTAASVKIRQLFDLGEIPDDIAADICEAYADLAGTDPAVAVRSSATAEDLPELSFAGQQDTYLNIRTAEGVLQAVKRCWASLWTPRAIDYRQRHGIDAGDDGSSLALAVVVQLLVPADAAGIMFTANPLNGRRDELLISAAWGLGEAVVGGLVTPDTLAFEKSTMRLIERQTADKQVMTVRTQSGTEEVEVPQELQHKPAVSDQEATRIAQLGLRIEKLYGLPMDIEWALHNNQVAILQARPITALPEALPAASTEWQLPPNTRMAMRNNIVEMMPAPLTPLFSTLGLAAVNNSMNRLLADFFGRSDIMPPEIIITVNKYAYYNGSIPAASIARILWGSIGIARRMFGGAVERWTEQGRPIYKQLVTEKQASNWRELRAMDLLGEISQLAEATIDAYGALVSGVIPAAWISEGLFTFVYNTFIKRKDDPQAAVFLLGFNNIPIRAEKTLYDLSLWARSEPQLSAYLVQTPVEQLARAMLENEPPSNIDEELWRQWRSRFHGHLLRYGHSIYNLDFANPTPADDPAPLLELCKLFIIGQGSNPHLRQEAAAERRERYTEILNSRLGPIRRRLFNRFLRTAQRFAPLREDGLADVGLSYPLLRQMLRELGRRFAAVGINETADDIFWLTKDEAENAARRFDGLSYEEGLIANIATRKIEWQTANLVSPPRALPTPKLFGRDLSTLKKRKSQDNVLKGVGASPGRVTGTAQVLHGPEDFGQMQTGDILVAAITTPAWTPLFVRAAAVVTNIGGPLSHGSIVAREYGIPAVLGTAEATSRIRSGDVITVDGSTGQVLLSDGQVDQSPTHNPTSGEWNDSLAGDYLWSNANFSEALPEVMTPSSWSLWRIFHEETMPIPLPGDIPFAGNIAGRAYANVSLLYSIYRLGGSHEQALTRVQEMLGRVPADVAIPVIPFSRWQMLSMIPQSLRWQRRSKQLIRQTPSFLANSPLLCRQLRSGIQEIDSAAKLITSWHHDLRPALMTSFWMLRAAMKQFAEQGSGLRRELEELVGQEDANALLSNLGGSELASLGPLIGLSKLALGEISREQYLDSYAHRGPNECEIFIPQPADDPHWLNEQLLQLKEAPVNVDTLLAQQDAAYDSAVKRLKEQHPRQAQKTLRRLEKRAQASRTREAVRSEMVRTARVVRTFAQRAGEFTNLGDGIFFLSLDEMLENLAGFAGMVQYIPNRRETYERYRSYPTYPALISGRFDPQEWVNDPHRRVDIYKACGTAQPDILDRPKLQAEEITGFSGATGVVEGRVRVLRNAGEAGQLQPGEILVTVTTNVGWTPIFPRAAAVVTDVGAPLSHAAIVARELGIPAVVGCGDATARLKSGDRVRVDGAQGRVEIIA